MPYSENQPRRANEGCIDASKATYLDNISILFNKWIVDRFVNVNALPKVNDISSISLHGDDIG